MKFLEEVQFSDNEFGILIVFKLAEGWEYAARKFPVNRLDEILKSSVDFAQRRLKEMQEKVQLQGGEYGLHHISLIPERAGLDLFSSQNSVAISNADIKPMTMRVL